MVMKSDATGNVQSVERALDVLTALADVGEMGPTDLGVRLGLHKSTVYRLLKTLASRGFVLQDARTELYSLGPTALRVAQRLIVSPDLAEVARRTLELLRDETGETSVLDVRMGDSRICIASAESQHEIRRAQRLAWPMDIHAGACGRVLLMRATNQELNEIAQRGPFTRLTARTPSSVAVLRRHINQLNQRGFTISSGERVEGATTVAVPVCNASGSVVAALAVTGPSFRFDTRRAQEVVPSLLQEAARLSQRLGTRASAWPSAGETVG